MKNKTIFPTVMGLLASFILVMLDQWSKMAAVKILKNASDITLIPGVLQLHYLENTGGAFSLFENKMALFYITTPILVLVILYLFFKTPFNRRFFPLWLTYVFLIAGAIGNLIDRILYQYVIDFIYFSLIDFPVFNVADIYVTCSVFVLFYLILFYFKDLDELTELYRKPGKKQGKEKL